jgi:2-iminobutanoate/2-iminopropanoate deaminase
MSAHVHGLNHMPKQAIHSPHVHRSTAPLAHAVRTGHLVFVSGIPPFGPGGQVVRGDFAAQARQCLQNVRHILQEAGTDLQHVVKVNVFLDTRGDFEELNAIYREFFGDDPAQWPARTTVEARLPRKEFLLEIECVAEVPGA